MGDNAGILLTSSREPSSSFFFSFFLSFSSDISFSLLFYREQFCRNYYINDIINFELMEDIWEKRNPQRIRMEGDALEKSGKRFGDRVERGRIEKSCRRPRRIGADERKEFGEWECHDLFFHYNGNAVRDGGGGMDRNELAAHGDRLETVEFLYRITEIAI